LNPKIYNIVLRKGSSTTYRAALEGTSCHVHFSMQPVIIIFGIIAWELKRRIISPFFCHLMDMIPTRERYINFYSVIKIYKVGVRGIGFSYIHLPSHH
jgi:hypothetical protein